MIIMIEKADIQRVKELLSQNIGKKIKLSAKKGRKRVITRHGVIKETYPSIFLVTLDSISEFADTDRTASYSYADVLTKTIEITVVDTKQVIQ